MAEKNIIDIDGITRDVALLLSADKSGHGMEHVGRVLALAIAFAQEQGADEDIVRLAALLHDVDDYKLFGQKYADDLINAQSILDKYNVNKQAKTAVLDIIKSMGYNKYLEGIRPQTVEGMIVSDADMCDAIGAMGVLRTHAYALSKGNEFFDAHISPDNTSMSASEYRASKKSHSVQHFFDKLLVIPLILMTESGRKEGHKRRIIMVQFLRQLFNEENSQEWLSYLDAFERTSVK
jgi:uncharacterized protein